MSQINKPLELDLPEDAVPIIEEKIEDESSPTEDTEDASADEVSLDDEEINPFGDKWEQ